MELAKFTSYNSKNWLIYRIWQEKLWEILPYFSGELLDIGCGHKPYLDILKDKVTSYVGLEYPGTPSLSAVVDVYGTGTELPFAAASFDTIVSFAVLEHVAEPELLLAEAGRVIKQGGFLIMSVPHIWGLHEEPHDYFRYTRFGIEFLLRQGGFRVVTIEALAGFWVTYTQRLCYYVELFRKILPRFLLITLYYLIQALGEELDKLHRVENETWCYLAIGQKI